MEEKIKIAIIEDKNSAIEGQGEENPILEALWVGKSDIFSCRALSHSFLLYSCRACGGLFHAQESSLGAIINCPNCNKKIKLSIEPII